jgi:hypothetical protein
VRVSTRRVFGQGEQPIAIEQPQKPCGGDPRKWPIAVAPEQVEWFPAERHGHGSKVAIKKPTDVVDEGLPALERHVAGRPIGVGPGKSFGSCVRDITIMLEDRRTFVLGTAPDRRRGRCCGVLWQLCNLF